MPMCVLPIALLFSIVILCVSIQTVERCKSWSVLQFWEYLPYKRSMFVRIFDSMDADPDLVRETMIRAQDTISWRLWLDRFLMKIPFFGRLITNEDNIPSD